MADGSAERLYLTVYRYFRELIESGQMQEGEKLLSVRRCCEQMEISRTTVERAYALLTEEGFIVSRPQSGYYVAAGKTGSRPTADQKGADPVRFDFSARSVDRESFDLASWRRYIKSALREDAGLLSYGEPQGERELREELADYLAKTRGLLCSADQIVIGAGTQSLLQILCPFLKGRGAVSFPTDSMRHSISVFRDYGFEIHVKDRNAAIIYVSPSRMNRMGDVMPMTRRRELAALVRERSSLLIEDDYENEYMIKSHPLPTLFALDGGQRTVYLGTFSRLLLPSIRLGYMVLPPDLAGKLREKLPMLNQTASRTEQIALAHWLRDGRMTRSLRKLRRLYQEKTHRMFTAVQAACPGFTVEERPLCVTVVIPAEISLGLNAALVAAGIRCDGFVRDARGVVRLVLSSLSIDTSDMETAAQALADVITQLNLSCTENIIALK